MPKGSFSPTIPQLRALEAVAATGSFEGASGTVTRSSIFNSIHGLERHINQLQVSGNPDPIKLTLPGSGRLTPEGHAILAPAVDFLTALVGFRNTCMRLRSRTNYLVVGCFPAHAERLAVAALPLIQDGVDVQIQVTDGSLARRGADLVASVERRELDLAIVPEGPVADGLQTTRLYSWQLRCVVGDDHRLAGKQTCDASSLRTERVLASPSGHVTRGVIEATGVIKVAFENNSSDALVALGRTGWGVALVADDCAPVRSSADAVRAKWPIVYHREQPLGGGVSLVTRAGPLDDTRLHDLVANLKANSASNPPNNDPTPS